MDLLTFKCDYEMGLLTLMMKGVSEPRMSIVFRDIKTIITKDELKKRVNRSEKDKLKRLENERNREEGKLPPTLPIS